jgi:hypothetical protein
MKKALLSRMRVLFILGHYLIAMKMKLSEAYLQCQDKSGRLGGMAGSVVLYVIAYALTLRGDSAYAI